MLNGDLPVSSPLGEALCAQNRSMIAVTALSMQNLRRFVLKLVLKRVLKCGQLAMTGWLKRAFLPLVHGRSVIHPSRRTIYRTVLACSSSRARPSRSTPACWALGCGPVDRPASAQGMPSCPQALLSRASPGFFRPYQRLTLGRCASCDRRAAFSHWPWS